MICSLGAATAHAHWTAAGCVHPVMERNLRSPCTDKRQFGSHSEEAIPYIFHHQYLNNIVSIYKIHLKHKHVSFTCWMVKLTTAKVSNVQVPPVRQKLRIQTVLSTPFQTVSVLLDLHDVNESTCPYMVISDTQVVSTETFYLQEAANQNNV